LSGQSAKGQFIVHVDDLSGQVGADLGRSSWRVITQEQVDAFADATDDHQWLHDPDRAAGGPFGGTIAHGYLTVSLVPVVLRELWRVEGVSHVLNYGLDRVRLPAPVPVGSRLRGRAVVQEVHDVPGGKQCKLDMTFEVEGGSKPACVAEVLIRFIAGPEGDRDGSVRAEAHGGNS
jgi:acyl dehydratase